MIRPVLLALLLAAPARAQFRQFNSAKAEVPPINFCAEAKLVIVAGSCKPEAAHKDVISPKACRDVSAALYDGLRYLYPNADVEYYQDLSADEVFSKLTRPNVKGFFFIGEGDAKGGFVTGPDRERIYPDVGVCGGGELDLFGGFTSFSKYSPEARPRKADTGKVLARREFVYSGAGAPAGSWPRLCKPGVSLVYPTRTFAGGMKTDVKKFLDLLGDEKLKHVVKTLNTICDNCRAHVDAGTRLAQFCPPNSDVCRVRKIPPGSEKMVMENYCAALAPTATRAER